MTWTSIFRLDIQNRKSNIELTVNPQNHHLEQDLQSIKCMGKERSNHRSVQWSIIGIFIELIIVQGIRNSKSLETNVKRKPVKQQQGAKSTTNDVSSPPEFSPKTGLVQCKNCSRNFAFDRIETHRNICKKMVKKRKPFDVSKARVEGTEAANFVGQTQRTRTKKVNYCLRNLIHWCYNNLDTTKIWLEKETRGICISIEGSQRSPKICC